jgi:hypothetical protein
MVMKHQNSHQLGKSRLQEEPFDQMTDDQNGQVSQFSSKKPSMVNLGLIFFGLFVFIVTASVFFRMYSNPVPVNQEPTEEIVFDQNQDSEDISLDKYGVIEISDVEIEYEEPEREFHIERRQQFCASNIDESHKLYSEYIGIKNKQIMEIKPRTVTEEQWVKEKTIQGAYKENLGVRETNYYWEYPTTGGNYVDLMRIHKCEVFNPGGRIIPIISVDEDGYIPEYELGILGLENLTEDDMVAYIQYLISLRHEEIEIQSISKKSVGDYLTLTLDMNYSGKTDWLKLRKGQEAYAEAIYKLSLNTGLLSYSEEIVVREIEPSPTPEL